MANKTFQDYLKQTYGAGLVECQCGKEEKG